MEQLLDSAMDVLRAVDDGPCYDSIHSEHVSYDARSDDAPQRQNRTDPAGLPLYPQSRRPPPTIFKEGCVERRLRSDQE